MPLDFILSYIVCVAVVVLALLAVIVGEAGQFLARRHGHQCPECDYRPPRITRDADMLIHRVLEHEQLRD